MEAVSLLLVCLITCLLFYYTWDSMHRIQGLPPGPSPLPFIGNLLQLRMGQLMESLRELNQKYGDVYTIYLGPRRVVVLCGYEAVKEALVDQAEEFGNRGHLPVVKGYTQGHGVVFGNGECWKQMRRFSLMSLRNFGMGKRSIEERILEEAKCLVKEFRKTNESPINPTYNFSQASSNIICSIIFGNRFDYHDPEFRRLMIIIYDIFKDMSCFWAQLFEIFDVIMRHIPGPHHRAVKGAFQLDDFIKERMKTNIETLNPENPRHLIDSFLIKMAEEKENPSTQFNMKNFLVNTNNLFIAGTETIGTTLRHGFLLLLKFPDITRKVQGEIDNVIGHQQMPASEDIDSMPYTDAVIHEIQRYGNVIPMNVPHKVLNDTRFRGFTIPKDTDVFPILTFVLQDPKYFPNPHIFDPTRFLDEHGKFKKNEAFMAFSAGKRVCLGEKLARLELFIFITTILQNFNITSPKQPKDLDLTPQMVGFSTLPQPYEISFIPR